MANIVKLESQIATLQSDSQSLEEQKKETEMELNILKEENVELKEEVRVIKKILEISSPTSSSGGKDGRDKI